MGITFQSPVLLVRDIAASRRFYEGLLEQKVEIDHGLYVEFGAGFALWDVAQATHVIYGQPAEDKAPLGRRNFELHFETEDLADVSAALAEAGVDFVHSVVEQPWGQRVLRVYDPDQHIVEFAEPMPAVIKRILNEGLTVEALTERTSMPLEIVQRIAQAGENA